MDKPRCQSCGMPLDIGFFGTNSDGTASIEYCKFCFENGNFREPNLTPEEMIGRSAARLVDDQKMTHEEAETLVETLIPHFEKMEITFDI